MATLTGDTKTITACVAAELTRLCVQIALPTPLLMAPRQQVCAIPRESIETAKAVSCTRNAVGNQTCQISLFQ